MTENEARIAQKPKFSIKTILSRSFSVFRKSPLFFIGLSFLAQIPGNLITFLADFSPEAGMLVLLVCFVFVVLIEGTTVYDVYATLRGNSVRFAKSISIGMARIGSLTLAALSFFAFLLVALFVALVLFVLIVAVLHMNNIFNLLEPKTLGVAMVVILVCIVTMWMFIKWGMFVPACVAERLAPIKSLKRSSELTRGFRLKIAGTFLLCTLFGLPFTLITHPSSPLRSSIVRTFITNLGPVTGHICISAFFSILSAIPTAFFYSVNIVTYYSLREAKEGVPVDKLSNSFD